MSVHNYRQSHVMRPVSDSTNRDVFITQTSTYRRYHRTDTQTDRQTDRQTDITQKTNSKII